MLHAVYHCMHMFAGDVSFEEVRWKDAAEQRSGQKQSFALAQELQQAAAAKQQDIEEMLRVRGQGLAAAAAAAAAAAQMTAKSRAVCIACLGAGGTVIC
jgi:hypothetical protein